MFAQRVIAVLVLPLLMIGSPVALAQDFDNDGVDDAVDVCSNTPPNTAVDSAGRPLGDLDGDCDTDLDDYQLFSLGFTGPLDPVGACCQPDGTCVVMAELDCGGEWHGTGTGCDPDPCEAAPPGMTLVAGGSFEMGDPWSEGESDELPVHTVELSPYAIDILPVTNQRYADGLNWANAQGGLISVIAGVVYQAGMGTAFPYCNTTQAATSTLITWDGGTFGVVPGWEDRPVVDVTWYGAVAFCNWRSVMDGRSPCYDLFSWNCDFGADGFRLPTEAEWEKAAAWDPVLAYHFRFGEHSDGCSLNCLDGQRGNYWLSGDPYEEGGLRMTPVGFYNGDLHDKAEFGWPGPEPFYQTQDARSFYGCYDMAGNVFEWCHDWYSAGYYAVSPTTNPSGPGASEFRVLRGGSFARDPYEARSAYRFMHFPDWRLSMVGFRCASGAH